MLRLKWSLQYAWLTVKHKWFVFVAGRRLQLGLWQLIIHDLSKFSLAELPAYGRSFFGDKGDPEGFARAWLHHQNVNPHHWEYWMPRSGHLKADPTMKLPPPLEMPQKYAVEMIADWMGAGRGYTGSWNCRPWLTKNWPRIVTNLHPKTAQMVWDLLQALPEFNS